MAITPIIIPIHRTTHSHSSGNTCFIQSDKGNYINIGASSECGVMKTINGNYWIWFRISGETKYYQTCFDNKKDANEFLKELLSKLESK